MEPVHTELPSTVLKREHQVILRVLDVLERLLDETRRSDEVPRDALARSLEFFRLFADACHHAKEEDLLFPVLESRGIPREGGPIGVMLHEHVLARGFVKEMGDALERLSNDPGAMDDLHRAGREYLSLLRQHIFKEDNVLFMAGDQVMNDDDQRQLHSGFCEAGCRAFGGKRREELEAMADELEAEWGPSA